MKDERAHSKTATLTMEEPAERRRLLSGLAGALGIVALAGCQSSLEESTAEAASALSGTNVGWVDTVLGLNLDGDLLTSVPANLGGCVVVIARGSKRPGDGGGGLFYWDAASAEAHNQGTVIRPQNLPTGRWKRIYSGPLDVRWFGAQGNGVDNDTAAINAAIAACCRTYVDGNPDLGGPGGTVYLPRGEYMVTDVLVLPRNRFFSFALVGDGPRATFLVSTLPWPGQASMIVDPSTIAPSFRLSIRDLFFRRAGTGGPVFEHVSQNSEQMRIEHLWIHNVIFQNLTAAGGTGPGTTVRLQTAINSRIEDVEVYGGETLLALESCARCAVVNFSTGMDNTMVHGIRITGGGQHTLSGIRIESCFHGDALALQGCADVDVLNFTNEGKETARVVAITNGTRCVTLRETVVGTGRAATGSWGDGIHVDGTSSHVRIEGGQFQDCTYGSGRALRVLAGATGIRAASWRHHGAAAQAASNVEIEEGALDVRVEILPLYGDRLELTAGTLGDPSRDGTSLAMGPFDVLTVGAPPMTVANVVQGSSGNQHSTTAALAGRRVTLVFTSAGHQVVGDDKIRLSQCRAYDPPQGAVLSLLHDGKHWIEVARAEPQTTC